MPPCLSFSTLTWRALRLAWQRFSASGHPMLSWFYEFSSYFIYSIGYDPEMDTVFAQRVSVWRPQPAFWSTDHEFGVSGPSFDLFRFSSAAPFDFRFAARYFDSHAPSPTTLSRRDSCLGCWLVSLGNWQSEVFAAVVLFSWGEIPQVDGTTCFWGKGLGMTMIEHILVTDGNRFTRVEMNVCFACFLVEAMTNIGRCTVWGLMGCIFGKGVPVFPIGRSIR